MSLTYTDFGALSTSPSRNEIAGMFPSTIAATFTNKSLKDMYNFFTYGNKDYGSFHRREAFSTRRRVYWTDNGITTTSTSKTASSVTANLYPISGNGQGYATGMRLAYHKNNGQTAFNGSQTVYRTSWMTPDFVMENITASGLTPSTTYWFRVEAYNGFGSATDYWYGGNASILTAAAPSWAVPAVTSWGGSFASMYAYWNQYDEFSGKQPDSFECRYRVNMYYWQTGSFTGSTNWNHYYNPKDGTWGYGGQLPNFGDSVDWEIRASEDADALASAWVRVGTFNP